MYRVFLLIVHFRVPKTLTLKMRPSVRMYNLPCENDFYLRENEKSPCQRLST